MNPFHTVHSRLGLALLAGLLLAAGPAAVRAAPSPGSPLARAEAFVAELQAGRTDQAFTALFADSPTTRTRTLYPAERRSDLTSYQQSYGDIIGAELLHQFHHGHSVVRLVYILKLRDFPVICELVFYRADQAWTLSRLEFSDQFEDLP